MNMLRILEIKGHPAPRHYNPLHKHCVGSQSAPACAKWTVSSRVDQSPTVYVEWLHCAISMHS